METQTQYCKRLIYKNFGNSEIPCIVLGLVIEETHDYIKFKSAKREILLSKTLVLSLEDTNIPFREWGQL